MRGYASTPRKSESNAPGPDYKLISLREDGDDHGAHPKLNGLVAGVERTGASVTITNHGLPVAVAALMR